MVSTVGKVPTAQEMFLAVFISDPNDVVARGAMTAVNAVNNNTLLRKICTQRVLERHSSNNAEMYGNPENSLNRVPRRDGEGFMNAAERLAYYTQEADEGTIPIPTGQQDKISWGQQMSVNAGYQAKCELKRVALVAQLTEATQLLRPFIAATVAELHAHPELLKLYNRSDPRALLSAAQSLLGTVTRTDITVLRSLRAQLSARPREVSENEWYIKLDTMNKSLAILADELFLSAQEIQNTFLATVHSTTWTAENAKYLSDLAEEEATENASPARKDAADYRKHVEMISRRVANKAALLPPPPSAFGVQSAPLPVAAPATAPAKAPENATKCTSCNRWHKASKACKPAAPAPAVSAAVPAQTAAAAPPAPPRAGRGPMVCFRCGLEGHGSADCENADLDLIRSWKESTACAELKERMKVRPAVFATQSPPARSSKLIADTACTPVSITATPRLVANRRMIEGTFTTAAGPGKIIATGTLNVLQPALAVLPVAQVESLPGCLPSPNLLSIPSFLNSDPTASAVAPAAPKG